MGNNANLGYLFQRDYYRGLTYEIWADASKKKTDQGRYFNNQNSRLIQSSKRKVFTDFSLIPRGDDRLVTIELETIYPGLITGIGMVHQTGMQGECKLGMTFDYTSGIPSIAGSSVKGMLRSAFPILASNKSLDKLTEEEKKAIDSKRAFIRSIWNELKEKEKATLPDICDSDIDELANLIFNGLKKDGKYLPMYERDVFFDAEIDGDYSQNGILGLDYITPHKNELADPNPIQFLKIMPGVKFVFHFRLDDTSLSSGITITKNAKKDLFKKILKTIGIGAKTNVGYGQLGDVSVKKKTIENNVLPESQSPVFNEEQKSIEGVVNIESDVETVPETNMRMSVSEIEEKESSGELVHLNGLKVRINDPKYSKTLFDLKFKQQSDKNQIKKSTKKVNVTLKVKNYKVKEVYFRSVSQ